MSPDPDWGICEWGAVGGRRPRRAIEVKRRGARRAPLGVPACLWVRAPGGVPA